LRRLELVALDEEMRIRGAQPAGSAVVIVMIDDASVAAVGRWPIPRRKLADAIGLLSAAGATTIGIDLLFAERESVGNDQASADQESGGDAALAELGGAIDIGPLRVPTDSATRMLVNYRGPPPAFPTYGFAQVLAGTVDPKVFRDRLVLIGSNALGARDTFVSPFTAVMPGVERLATVVDSMLRGNHLRRPGAMPWYESVAMLVIALALALAVSRLSLAVAALSFVYNWISNNRVDHKKEVRELKAEFDKRITGLHSTHRTEMQTLRSTSYNNFTRAVSQAQENNAAISRLELKLEQRLALHPTREERRPFRRAQHRDCRFRGGDHRFHGLGLPRR